jgi:hypothetical protein
MRILLTLLILVSSTANAQQQTILERMQQTFQSKQKALLAQYNSDLDSVLEQLKKQGDLDNFLTVQAEKKRFGESESIPLPSEVLKPLQPVSSAYYNALTLLNENYINALENLIKQNVKLGKIEDAKQTKAEKDRIVSTLCELRSKLPQTLKPSKDETKPAPIKDEKPAVSRTKDLLLHYAFDGLWKTTVSDKSGQGTEGTLQGGARASRNTNSKACLFNGKTDFLVTQTPLEIKGSESWTISVWFKANRPTQPFDNIVSLGKAFVPHGIFGIGAGNDLNSININLWGPDNYTVLTGIDCSKAFVHVAVVYDGKRALLYINGDLKDERPLQLSLVKSPVWIGGRTGGYKGQYFNGILGEVMIFKDSLSGKEVLALYKDQI